MSEKAKRKWERRSAAFRQSALERMKNGGEKEAPTEAGMAVRRRKSAAGRRGGAGCGQNAYGERTGKRSGSGNGARGAGYLPVGGLHQRSAVGGQANPGVQDSHPGSVPVGLASQGFLIGDPGQPSQMTPIGAGQVSPIGAGQLSADGGGHGRFQRGCRRIACNGRNSPRSGINAIAGDVTRRTMHLWCARAGDLFSER